jgi:hypothetical protein
MPLSPDRYKLQLTIGGDTLEKLRLAQDMLGHAIPSGDEATILDRALTALLVELAKQKFSDTRKPRPPAARKRVRAIPRLRSSARFGCGISGVAPSSELLAIVATSAASSSSPTSIRTLWVARRPSTRSNCGAVATTITKAGCISASADVEPMTGS